MDSDVCRELLYHLDSDGSLSIGNAPAKVAKWLKALELPWALSQVLHFYWPQKCGSIAHIRLWPSRDLPKDPLLEELLDLKLLPIGCAPNGDSLVINFATDKCEVGFISHELWADEADKTPDRIYQPIARTLDSFLYRIAEGKYVPTDYHAAQAFNKFLKEEKDSA